MNGFLPDVGLALSSVVGEIERNGSTDVEINYSSLKVRCQFRERERERETEWRAGAIAMEAQWAPLSAPLNTASKRLPPSLPPSQF